MLWLSSAAKRYLDEGSSGLTSQADLLEEYDGVLKRGWRAVDDAVLLAAWHESYFGDRQSFPFVMDYEIAVNGRGIPDFDLSGESNQRISTLLRRGLAFAWAALHVQFQQLPQVTVSAYVTISPMVFEPDEFTGNVTFCTVRPGRRPYIDPGLLHDEIVASMSTGDCHDALPASRSGRQ